MSQTCSLESFETGSFVTFDTIQTGRTITESGSAPPLLSVSRAAFITTVKKELNQLFSEQIYRDTDIFDPPQLGSFASKENVEAKLIRLNRWYNWVPHRHGNRTQVDILIEEYIDLVDSVISHPSYNDTKGIPAHKFWHLFSQNPSIIWTENIRRVLRYLLSLSASISQCERNFSLYNQEKMKSRASLNSATVESLVRIRRNLNNDLSDEEYVYYAREFCATHSRSDDESRAGSHGNRKGAIQDELGGDIADEKVSKPDMGVPFRAKAF